MSSRRHEGGKEHIRTSSRPMGQHMIRGQNRNVTRWGEEWGKAIVEVMACLRKWWSHVRSNPEGQSISSCPMPRMTAESFPRQLLHDQTADMTAYDGDRETITGSSANFDNRISINKQKVRVL